MSNHVKTNKDTKKLYSRSLSESIMLLFPVFLIVIILPTIVKMHTYHSRLNMFDWFTTGDISYDFFLFYKQWFFVGISGLLALIIAGRALFDRRTIAFHKIFIPLFTYVALVILSTLFSDYLSFGITGNMEQFENVFCQIGYILVAYYIFLIVQGPTEIKLIINALAIGGIIVCGIGIFQSFGFDFFNSDFGRSVIVEKGMDPSTLSITFGKGRVYATLYNPNYVGVYTTLLISIYSILFIFAKNLMETVLYGLVIVTSAFSMFGSQFKAGLVCLIIMFIVTGAFLRKRLLVKWKQVCFILVSFAVAFLVTDHNSDGAYTDSISDAINNATYSSDSSLKGMDTSEDGIEVNLNNNIVKIAMDQNKNWVVRDHSGEALEYSVVEENEGYVASVIDDIRFEDIILIMFQEGQNGDVDFSFLINDYTWSFQYDENQQTYLHYNRYGKFSPILTADRAKVFDGHEFFASRRGYIWGRALPLFADYLILGAGADSFVQAFPQYDYVGMYNYGYIEQLITKPHCLYIQIGVQSGVISLVMFLLFHLLYSIQSVKLYFKNDFKEETSIIGLAVFVGILGFLVSGLSNDSSICVSPVYWVVVGLGISINLNKLE